MPLNSLSRPGGLVALPLRRRSPSAESTLPRLPPFALHVNLAQASQVQIAIGRLEALTMGRQCDAFAAPRLRHERLEVLVAVGHRVISR